MRHGRELVSILDEGFAKLTLDEACRRLQAGDIAYEMVSTAGDNLSDRQAKENHYISPLSRKTVKNSCCRRLRSVRDTGLPPIAMLRAFCRCVELMKRAGYSMEQISALGGKKQFSSRVNSTAGCFHELIFPSEKRSS
jgi:crotonobetainyl-CoA:carnitine CoA-transferase CaiB-like acyl-CoA transferase